MQLCKTGGRVVYSTCSLNPVEDEAVVSACLQQASGHFRLVDIRHELPTLKCSPGMTSWCVMSKDLRYTFHSYAEVQEHLHTTTPSADNDTHTFKSHKSTIGTRPTPSMFPPPASILSSQNLSLCCRILPHQQDTGGFFIASFECISAIPPPSSLRLGCHTGQAVQSQYNKCIPAPLRVLTPAMKQTVQAALALPDTFPLHQLLYRNDLTRVQKIYYACQGVLDLLPYLGSRVSYAGAKVFEAYVKHSNDKLRYFPDSVRSLAPLLQTCCDELCGASDDDK
uniref:tRNA (Cytosine(34)-C(5))-methyltransferase n=1 Tax=Lygus hesperus TaxID=30085 RepID=A0A0A9Z6S8_LYGHE